MSTYSKGTHRILAEKTYSDGAKEIIALYAYPNNLDWDVSGYEKQGLRIVEVSQKPKKRWEEYHG